MNNILIPLDMSSLPRGALLYSLHLMRGRECNFYFVPVSFNQSLFNSRPFNNSKFECIQFALNREVIALQKKIKNSFPEEHYKFFLLDSLKSFQKKVGQIMLTILTNELKNMNMSMLYKQLLSKVKTPWLFVSKKTKFTIPKKVLLKIEPDVEINQAILTPLKTLYGNQSFFLEIQKINSDSDNLEDTRRDELKLKELFDIYHPVIKLVNRENGAISKALYNRQKYDLEILPQNEESLKLKMSESDFFKSLSSLEVPILIIPETEKNYQINLRRSQKNKKPTLFHR